MRFLDKDVDVASLSMLDLAFLGDVVQELYVREALVSLGNRKTSDLHAAKIRFVNADAQKAAADFLSPFLTEQEASIYRRGRNTKTNHTPKNMSSASYHAATGLEALFGWLYLTDQEDRLKELLGLIYHRQAEEKPL